MSIVPVIMCGGGGTRLWPTSRSSRPKQFLRLLGDRSLFQDTVTRLADLPGVREPVVVAGVAHEDWVAEQLAELGLGATVLLEPTPRDSGPAIAAAVAHLAAEDPEAVMVVLASDHHIPSAAEFSAAIADAVIAARAGRLVVLGVRPTSPSSAYGYIQPGECLDGHARGRQVARFVEKPDATTATRYVAEGCLWNSGNFVAPVGLLAEEFERHCPGLLAPVSRALAAADVAGPVRRLASGFSEVPKISFDYAVMEKTARAAVLPVDFVWSDLGAWDAVWAAGTKDENCNSVSGPAVLIDTARTVVRAAPGVAVATVGVHNLAVIAEPDAVLVCSLDHAQGVKAVVERIKFHGWPQAEGPPRNEACDLAGYSRRLDDWLDVSALPLWWSLGADHTHGGFHEHLSLAGRPVSGLRRARVQMRQVYVYAGAGAAGWSGPWLQAVNHGLSYFHERYRRSDGLFRSLVDAAGAPADDTAMLYDQAFALLGWATAARATHNTALHAQALSTLAALQAQRRSPAGGYLEEGECAHVSNPHMHLLEAALAWMEVDGGVVWERLGAEIVQLALTRFIDPKHGYLREFFDAGWAPAPGSNGKVVEPGHQFEWSWLLARWAKATGDKAAMAAALRLFEHGVKGVDAARGVAVDALDDDVAVASLQARLWPQTERLKAALLLSELNPIRKGVYISHAGAAAKSLIRYLETPAPGVWRDKLGHDGSWREEPAPASSLYHIACAVWELRNAQAAAARGSPAGQPPGPVGVGEMAVQA